MRPAQRGRRLPVRGAVAVAALLAYGWWAGGLRQFGPTAYLAVSLPVGAVFLALVSRPRRRDRVPARLQRGSLRWALLLLAAICLEASDLVLGGRSREWPTFSTAADHLLGSHASRAVLIALWVVVGVLLARRAETLHETSSSLPR